MSRLKTKTPACIIGAARGDQSRTSVLRNMYTQTLVQPAWDLACAIMEILGDFHTTSHLHIRLRIEKNTSRQTVRFCVRQTCTQISNTAFPSHLCAPQSNNHNSSLIVTTDHRTHKPSLLTSKKVHTLSSTAFYKN